MQERITRTANPASSVVLTSQALPAAGAFTNQAATVLPRGTKRVAFWVKYTRGAAGGFPDLRVLWTNTLGTEGHETIVDRTLALTVAQPVASQLIYEEALLGPIPADASPIDYVIRFEVPAGTSAVRMIAAEKGVVATPGTIEIELGTDM